jgi:hypothetical protein
MGMFDEIKNKAEKAMRDHPEQLEKYSDQALERAGDAVDKATGDKYADQIDKAQRAGDDHIGS